jgi:2-C-methyl-D-erythritol 4-phosphate cytidylyltransferase/2-C-methyl-D-erythritol 4-phosphate cytidylyltransferase/2-C-methyl-D-erythritol 2,4-cyclodiphosphate synthase
MGGVKKEYRLLPRPEADGEKPTVLGACTRAFRDSGRIDLIVITVPAGDEERAREALPAGMRSGLELPKLIVTAGDRTRRASVFKALAAIAAEGGADYVLVHDGARPWLDADLIGRLIEAVQADSAVIPALPLVETPKEVSADGWITRHLRRASVVAAQTPQAFDFPRLLAAHQQAADALADANDHADYTDDAEVWAAYNGPVRVIPGSPANRKITFPEDLEP